jgi:sigma-B regulation protein RsbU (phosphoserine phosphatase)
MLDEIPSVIKYEIRIENYSKLVCYTDGLSELRYANGKEIGTTEIISHIMNDMPVETNMREMLESLGLPHKNPTTFDDVSIIAADLK